MRAEPPSPSTTQDRAPASDAIRSREQGLSLLSRANRWLIALAVLLAGALTGLTAHAFHSSKASAQTRSAPSQGSGEGSGGGASTSPLQSPASPPSAASPAPAAPAPAPAPPVVSGGS
jgi:hypothetical protein